MHPHPRLLLLAACAALAGVLVALLLRRWIAAWRLRRRCRRGLLGQQRARAVLERRGYRVLGEEVVLPGRMLVDGRPREFTARIDLVVKRRGRRYGVEVKTGQQAPDPLHRATRRQLLEYCWLLPLDGLLLLDMESGRLSSVAFPRRAGASSGWRAWAALGAAVGVAAGYLLARLG